MYKLFYSPGSAAMAPHALLEEIGGPFELVKVDTRSGEHKKAEYLKLNPNGRVPTLVDGDQVIYEAAAIMLHLVDRHPGSGLAPAVGSAERAMFYQWLIYMTNTVQEAYIEYYHPEYYARTEAGQAEVKAVSEERLQPMFAVLDKALEKGPFLLGATFSAADIFLTNVRPAALARAGVDYETLKAINPRLIYCSLTGYGLTGPDRDKPGMDVAAFWSRAGVGSITAPKGTEPFPIRTGMGDHVTSLATVSAILAAVH